MVPHLTKTHTETILQSNHTVLKRHFASYSDKHDIKQSGACDWVPLRWQIWCDFPLVENNVHVECFGEDSFITSLALTEILSVLLFRGQNSYLHWQFWSLYFCNWHELLNWDSDGRLWKSNSLIEETNKRILKEWALFECNAISSLLFFHFRMVTCSPRKPSVWADSRASLLNKEEPNRANDFYFHNSMAMVFLGKLFYIVVCLQKVSVCFSFPHFRMVKRKHNTHSHSHSY